MRLIDLHCNWLWQYATETTLHDPALYGEIPARLGRLNGYLQGTAVAILACARKPAEWERDGERWRSLGELIARYEAEFSGRLLIGADDVGRWRAEPPDGLCWGVLGVGGFDYLVREAADLDRIPGLFERGVRAFQLVASAANLLAGSAEPGDNRGLTELGRAFLARLEEVGNGRAAGPRPIVDLAHLNPRSMAEVLDWVGSESARAGRLLAIYSHGGVSHPGFDTPRALCRGNLTRLRSLGGLVGFTPGLPYYETPADLKAGIEAAAEVPFEGRPGFEGLAIGTDFLGIDRCLAGLAEVAQIKKWIGRVFDRQSAGLLLAGNGSQLLLRAAGARDDPARSER